MIKVIHVLIITIMDPSITDAIGVSFVEGSFNIIGQESVLYSEMQWVPLYTVWLLLRRIVFSLLFNK